MQTQRIDVTDHGITVAWQEPPLLSFRGVEMRPGTTGVDELPWDDISRVTLTVDELPPDGERWTELVVDLTWGEFLPVRADADGFAEAVRALCARSGTPLPDPAAATTTVWSRA
ncbi:PH domain-containing protein [Actinoplanes sp. NBRC 101535]|uniref:PH domain-containing protein n=1 Tax=Actinoplanes sp. NBRC 101535 TaxID=3032196 RepID=UPI0024A2782B|nr:PH domain-containing protein [Actinoplanes sp. NBRC 101535]GLY03027.1 hypothetical protein Acsp01_34060 [Actinoplanes sp. NBRC 101535]